MDAKLTLINKITELSKALQILIGFGSDSNAVEIFKCQDKAIAILTEQYGAFSLYFEEIRHTIEIDNLFGVINRYVYDTQDSIGDVVLLCVQWLNVYGHSGYVQQIPTEIDKPQQEQTAEPEQKPQGRPKKTFKDCLNGQTEEEKEERLRRLHNVIDGKKGKYVSLYILIAIELGWIEKPTSTQVENEFGDIGNKSGYNAYLHKNRFLDEEINGAIESLK